MPVEALVSFLIVCSGRVHFQRLLDLATLEVVVSEGALA